MEDRIILDRTAAYCHLSVQGTRGEFITILQKEASFDDTPSDSDEVRCVRISPVTGRAGQAVVELLRTNFRQGWKMIRVARVNAPPGDILEQYKRAAKIWPKVDQRANPVRELAQRFAAKFGWSLSL